VSQSGSFTIIEQKSWTKEKHTMASLSKRMMKTSVECPAAEEWVMSRVMPCGGRGMGYEYTCKVMS
jgi:hypothetical protein